MSAIQDVRLVTQANGCARVTALGENITTGIAYIYSAKLSIPDEGVSYNLDPLKSKKRDTQANYDCTGAFIGLTKGNQQYEEKTIDITFGDDYNFVVANSVDPTISRSTIIELMKGGTWYDSSSVIAGLGFNGTRNISTSTNTLAHKNICLEDGKLVDANLKTDTGAMTTSSNNAVTAYNDTTMAMLEFKYAFGTQTKGDRFCYFLAESVDFNEGSGADFNRYAVSGTRYCDPRDIEAYFIEDESDAQLVNGTPASATNIARVGKASNGVTTGNIYYGLVDTTDSDISTVTLTNGTIGDIIVLANDGSTGTAGEISVFVVTGATAASAIHTNYNFIQGARIHTTKQLAGLVTATGAVVIDASTGTDAYGKVVVATAGATSVAVATGNKTNTSGSGTVDYQFLIKDWSYASTSFITFVGVE